MTRLHSLPLFVRLAGRPVILIGDGEAAEAKRRLLDRAGATIVGEEESAALAIVVDDDAAVARLKTRGVLVNAVDRPELCDFTLPAIVDRSPVIVAVGTGGASAGLAAALRQRLETLLSPKLGALAELLSDWKVRLREKVPDPGERRRVIARALSPGGGLELDNPDLDNPFWIDDSRQTESKDSGSIAYVYVRYADPDMLTLRDARMLALADRVYHDADVPLAVIDRARADADRIAGSPPPIGTMPPPGLSVAIRIATR